MNPFRFRGVNPVLLFEARAITRSKLATVFTLLFLLLQLLGAGSYMVITRLLSGSGYFDADELQGGMIMFGIAYGILSVGLLQFVPLFSGIRMMRERSFLPILFSTELKPGQIMRGKLGSVIMLAGLTVALSLPFMVFLVMLRGIDYLTIFFAVSYLFLQCIVSSYYYFTIACLSAKVIVKAVIGIILFLYMMSVTLASITTAFMFSGSMAGMMQSMMLARLLTPFITMIILHQCCVVLLMPRSANRAPVLRIMITIAMVIMICLGKFSGTPFIFWIVPYLMLAFAVICSAVSSRVHPSDRIKRSIPRNMLKRVLVFPFFSGAANGLIFGGLVFLLLPLILGIEMGDLVRSVNLFLYAQLAVLLHRTLLKKKPIQYGWLILAAVAIIVNILPILFSFFLGFHQDSSTFAIGSVFKIDQSMIELHVLISGSLLIIFTVINWRWWLSQFRSFKPLEDEA